MQTRTLIRRAGLAVGAVVFLGACSNLLDVDIPDVIDPDNLATAQGAAALYAGALGDFALAHDGGNGDVYDGVDGLFGGVLMTSGLFTDEYRFGGTPPEVRQLDLEEVRKENSFFRDTYLALHRARVSAERAADALSQTVSPNDPRVGEMYALSGAAHIIIGEHFCSGTPFSATMEGGIDYGEPLSTDQIMDEALARLQTAAGSTGGDAGVQNLIAVLQGRAYVNLGQFANAAAAVGGVPTAFEYQIQHSADAARTQNLMKGFIFDFDYLSVSDGEGGAGLNFASANDPRLVVDNPGLSRFDGETPHFRFLRYDSFDASVTLASGVEARLIEAEAALDAGDIQAWLDGLTAARTFFGMVPVADPGTADGRVDLMFRERAFSLFSTGHRLGDMRRLMRQYGRARNAVFPSGPYHKDNLTRGSQVSFVVPVSEENNPNYAATDCDPTAP
jgi:hypothetical protein